MDAPTDLDEPVGAPPPAADLRGQLDIDLAGQSYRLRPSYEAIIKVERELGRGLIQLSSQADLGALSLGDVGTIVTRLIQADDDRAARWSTARVGQLVYAEQGGLDRMQAMLAIVLAEAATGGCTAEGNLRSGEAMTSGTTATPDVASQD